MTVLLDPNTIYHKKRVLRQDAQTQNTHDSALQPANLSLWCQKAYDFLSFSKVGPEIYLRVLNATWAAKHSVLLWVVNILAQKFSGLSHIRFEFVIPQGDLANFKVGGSPTGTLVGWKNWENQPWPQYLGSNKGFVIVTELGCTRTN